MQNPFGPKGGKITLTQYDVVNLIGAKEADLMIARGHLQQAAQTIEQLKAENAILRQRLDEKSKETGVKVTKPAKSVPELVK